jgi:GNAT superfamily N-acetyltransferase
VFFLCSPWSNYVHGQVLNVTGGQSRGFATVYWTWSTTTAARLAVMNDLFVSADARGSGAATALIEASRDVPWAGNDPGIGYS